MRQEKGSHLDFDLETSPGSESLGNRRLPYPRSIYTFSKCKKIPL